MDHFGIVYLDGGEADPDDIEAIIGADILLFTGVNRYHGHMAYIRLLGDPTYQFVTHDPLQHDGFAIFRKQLYPTRSLSRNRDEA